MEGTTSVGGDRRIASERRQTCVEYGADREGPDELFLVSAIDKDNWRGAQHIWRARNFTPNQWLQEFFMMSRLEQIAVLRLLQTFFLKSCIRLRRTFSCSNRYLRFFACFRMASLTVSSPSCSQLVIL